MQFHRSIMRYSSLDDTQCIFVQLVGFYPTQVKLQVTLLQGPVAMKARLHQAIACVRLHQHCSDACNTVLKLSFNGRSAESLDLKQRLSKMFLSVTQLSELMAHSYARTTRTTLVNWFGMERGYEQSNDEINRLFCFKEAIPFCGYFWYCQFEQTFRT